VTSDTLFRAANETVKVSFGYSVLLERVVIGVNRHGTESNDLIAVENSDVLALRRSLQKRGEIATGLGSGKAWPCVDFTTIWQATQSGAISYAPVSATMI
jgi:hypothetical protein